MDIPLVPFFLAGILTLVYIFSFKYASRGEKYHSYLLSLGSGMLISLIIAEIIPVLFVEGSQFLSINVLAFGVLLGFVGYHVIEKFAYQHARSKQMIVKEIGYMHVAGFFIDHVVEGFIIILFFALSAFENFLIYLLFVPLLIGDVAAAMTLRHTGERFKINNALFSILASGILIGAMFAFFLNLEKQSFYTSLSVLTGIFMYFIIRDEIPRGKAGKPLVFVIGAAIMFIMLALLR
jgi:uncharacterized membrane protein YecN with MAPEG domain